MAREKRIRIRVGGLLLNRKGELLLVYHKKKGRSYWLFPGGGVEYGEGIEKALKREFKEELSLRVKKVHNLVFAHDTVYPGKKRHILNLYFRVSVENTRKVKLNPDSVLKGSEFVTIEKFRKFLFYPDVKNVIIKSWKLRFVNTLGYIETKWKK